MMNHIGTQRIETERLVLRRFVPTDAEKMYRNWTSDPEVTKFLSWPTHPSAEVSAVVLKDWVDSYADEKYYQWAITLKEHPEEPIGSLAVVRMDESVGMVHIGYCIGRKWWHQGITSEALKAVIGFFFDRIGANRVEARHDTRNPHSGGVMKKCGMKYEGTLRSAGRNNQGICDEAYYGLLKNER